MRHKPFFKLFCILILMIYGSATVSAGQIITREERDWARQALSQESLPADLESTKSVAVLNFHNLTTQQQFDALQKGFAFMLITDLSKIEDLIVLERTKIQALLDEMAPGGSGLVDTATAPKVGKLLRAYYVVNGDIEEGAVGELEIGSYILDVPFESPTDLPPANGSLDELFRMEKEILFNIIEELNPYISAEKRLELEKPLSISAAALLTLFLGLEYSDKGMYEKAAEMYRRAITEDPGLQVARDALQEIDERGVSKPEELTSSKPVPEETVVEESSSWGTPAAVALGVVVVGGIVAMAGSSSSSSDSGGSGVTIPEESTNTDGITNPEGETQETDTTPPGVNVANNKQSISCAGDTVSFIFSEPVLPSSGIFSVGPGLFSTVLGNWNFDNTILTLALSSTSSAECLLPGSSAPFDTFVITISGYRDVNDNAMGVFESAYLAVPSAQ